MDVSEQGGHCHCVSEIRYQVYRNYNNDLISPKSCDSELVIRGLEAAQNQIEVGRWGNGSPSVTLGTISNQGFGGQEVQPRTVTRYLECQRPMFVTRRTKEQKPMNSDSSSLQALESWYQEINRVSNTNVLFMRSDHPFAFHSRHAIGGTFTVGTSTYPLDGINGGRKTQWRKR